VAWATCYYYNTYTQAWDENVNVSVGLGDPVARTHILSPAFLYNLDNGGIDNGMVTQAEVPRLNDIGCSSWNTMPYNELDSTTWPTGAAWIDALKFRTKGPWSYRLAGR
jgi:hypothetical protein